MGLKPRNSEVLKQQLIDQGSYDDLKSQFERQFDSTTFDEDDQIKRQLEEQLQQQLESSFPSEKNSS